MTEKVNAGGAVENTETKAVETNVDVAAHSQAEVDLAAALTQKEAEIEQTRTERENYKRGMLKAKGKLPEDDEEDADEKMRRIVREEMLATKEAQLQKEKDAITSKALKELAEARIALRNRSGSIPTGGSSSQIENEKKEEDFSKVFSAQQLADLKAKGLDPKKVAENLKNPGGFHR